MIILVNSSVLGEPSISEENVNRFCLTAKLDAPEPSPPFVEKTEILIEINALLTVIMWVLPKTGFVIRTPKTQLFRRKLIIQKIQRPFRPFARDVLEISESIQFALKTEIPTKTSANAPVKITEFVLNTLMVLAPIPI